ncbi:hypothetical protein Lgee_0744 [Legionella geestiana]|uniref:Uncharacterized protein n=1 Tax=Legionella geestiana TaxID=45065 RepID=A0A0W0U3D0_9GAMM|nr:hypothetical protein [Legionella geestiana]KTD02119.1 hypothetical protein Lgee_0744 [Legionella geestiana]STX53773.1 Uncharacterised protein [Legionella geestiana]
MDIKAHIYRGIIQYLRENANYSLKSIALLSNSPLKHIRTIFNHNTVPNDFSSEIELVRLFQIILEIKSEDPFSGIMYPAKAPIEPPSKALRI